ncbi:MAG TPA: hypothetical protein VKQ08_06255 [Cyclobacteriaceae bacterium]|nr:hypothetical protein [Cyclobacteriaceae bacterium]
MNKAGLHISETQSIKEIQERFSQVYPFLKIDFFKKGCDGRKFGLQNAKYYPDVKMKDIENHFAGELEIDDTMTVSELESKLFACFGLNAHLSRRSGDIWLEVSVTNHWTLKQQNDLGKEILPFKIPRD